MLKPDKHYEIRGKDALLLFGKHSGEFVSDLAIEDVEYLQWLLDNVEMPEDLYEVVYAFA